MKNITLLLSFILLVQTPGFSQTVAPEKIQKDGLQIGKASSLLPKELIFDAGEGASNKKLSLDPADNEFDLNSTLNITGDLDASGAANITGQTSTGSLSVTGASAHQSGLTLGSGTDASKQITVDRAGADPFLKWNETVGKWTFSNDGSVEKNFGSGSGGDTGITVLTNGSFEDGISVEWTNVGGTFTSETYATPDPSGNDTVFARFIASGAGQYFETVAAAVPSTVSGGCLAKINYNTTDAENWRLQVYDGSSNLLKETTLYAKTWVDGHAPFPCPTVGTLIKLRVISIAAGQIEADKGYLGKENRTFQVAQATIAGESYFPPAASCNWARANTVLGPFTSDAPCLGPSITSSNLGSWQTTDADLPRQTINNLPAGTYKAKFFGHAVMTSSTATPAYAINDGTTTCVSTSGSSLTTNQGLFYTECSFTYATAGNRTFELYGASSAGGVDVLNNVTAPAPALKFVLEFWPNSSDTALRPEAQDWFIDANIGGANPALGAVNVSSYTEITNASLDLVLNNGSASAKIPCSATNASSGLTCSSGNEGIGIVFTPPTPGLYEVCGSFTSEVVIGGSSSYIIPTFQFVETTPSTQTIIQEGKARTVSGYQGNSSGSVASISSHRNCGVFRFDSVSERTIRLMYEQNVSGTVSSSSIVSDRSAAAGQRDVHLVVRPLLSPYNRPYLVGEQVTKPNTEKAKTCVYTMGGNGSTISAYVVTSTTPVVEVYDDCNMATSTARSGVGEFSVIFGGWKPGIVLDCTAEGGGGGTAHLTNFTATDSSGNATVTLRGRGNSFTQSDVSGVKISCTGDRQ